MNSSSPTHEEIAQHAYQIYVRNGRQHGQAIEHWLQAEAELMKRTRSTSAPAAAAPRASNGGAKAANTKTAAPSAAAAKSKAPLKKAPKSAK